MSSLWDQRLGSTSTRWRLRLRLGHGRVVAGRTFLLESATEPPDRAFELVHEADGFRVFATPGLVEPEELHLELSRRGKLRAFWNGQAWIG